jgi:hypothetical protein
MQIKIQDPRKAVTAENTERKAKRAQRIYALRSFRLQLQFSEGKSHILSLFAYGVQDGIIQHALFT